MYTSDGSSKIHKIDGESMTVVDVINVTDPLTGRNVIRINELEWVDGFIYANIWYEDVLI